VDAVDGRYLFVGLPPDTYIVQETNPPGYISTTSDRVLVQLMANVRLEIHFGDAALPTPTATPTSTVTCTPRPTKTPTQVPTRPSRPYHLHFPLLFGKSSIIPSLSPMSLWLYHGPIALFHQLRRCGSLPVGCCWQPGIGGLGGCGAAV